MIIMGYRGMGKLCRIFSTVINFNLNLSKTSRKRSTKEDIIGSLITDVSSIVHYYFSNLKILRKMKTTNAKRVLSQHKSVSKPHSSLKSVESPNPHTPHFFLDHSFNARPKK